MAYYDLYTSDDGNGYTGSSPTSVEEGTEYGISAVPYSGYRFKQWTGDTDHLDNPYSDSATVTMPSEDVCLTATFEAIYTLTVYNGTGGGEYAEGETPEISASPPEGYHFDAWTGDTEHLGNPYASPTTVTMPGHEVTVSATFDDVTYTLTVNEGTGSGEYGVGQTPSISATVPEGHVFSLWNGDTSFVNDAYAADTFVTMPDQVVFLTAIFVDAFTLTVTNGSGSGLYAEGGHPGIVADAPAEGYRFKEWTGDTDHVDGPYSSSSTVTMPAEAVSVTATYEAVYNLTVGNGTGSGDYAEGETPTITADAPAEGYGFKEWTGDTDYVADVNSSSTTVTMPAEAVSVTATYELVYALEVVNGTGSGNYAEGEVVNITADEPEPGYEFDDWGGNAEHITGGDYASTTVTMPAHEVSVTANYVLTTTYALTVTNGSGGGQYGEGQTPAITADAPAEGYRFKQWTGDTAYVADANASSTTVTMPAQAVSVTAAYEALPTHLLTVVNGTGGDTLYEGQTVEVVADAAPEGQMFSGWTGDTSGVANVAAAHTTFTMSTSAATITATYTQKPGSRRLALLDAK